MDTYSSNVVGSTTIEDGHFEFKLAKDKIRSGLISIRYLDEEKPDLLGFPLAESRKSFHTWFFVEDGVTKLEEFEDIDVKGAKAGYFARVNEDGYENRLVRQYPTFKLSSHTNYNQILADYKESIGNNRNSKFLVGWLFRNRKEFDVADLKKLFSLFAIDAQESFYGRILSAFFDTSMLPSSFSLANDRVGLVQDIDKRNTVNILAFRGKTAIPFLPESPYLDRLEAMYQKNEMVTLSRITTEKDPVNWRSSLQHYRPALTQLIADKTYVDFLYFKYNFRGIPLVIFTDEHGRLLKRMEGYRQAKLTDYVALINVNL